MSHTSTQTQREWVERVLGYTAPPISGTPKGTNGTGKQVRFAVSGKDAGLDKSARQVMQSRPGIKLGSRGKVGSVQSGVPTGPKTKVKGAGGRELDISIGTDGRVAMTYPPPPMQEITFSGGGGKGSALPGAVKALQELGALKEAKVLNGASVGSMTAALVAAGITAEDFKTISNDPHTGEVISQGRGTVGLVLKGIAGDRLSGDGLENLMRQTIGQSVQKQIKKYLSTGTPDPQVLATLQQIDGKIARGGGVTFGELRTLSKVIPDIKELNVAGTFMADDSGTPGKMEKTGKPQLAIFNADTEPDLDIATAVHASAALPPVFQPVNIRLSSGVTARFEDGGVMNNAPTTDLVGAKRSLDPMPDGGKMAFVFEGDDDEVLQGDATPEFKAMNDRFSKAPNSAAEYAKKRGLADRPEEVVKVPLKFTVPGKNGKKGKEKDFSSFTSGTLNMNMKVEDKLALQDVTEKATQAYLDKRNEPKTTKFDSVTQMLNCVSREDLAAMAQDDFPGAKEELEFRDAVSDAVKTLEATAQGAKAGDLQGGKVRTALDALNQLAGGDVDRLGFVARELNRSGKLDPLMTLAKASGNQGLDVLKAGVAVANALDSKSRAQFVLREAVYPKLVKEKAKTSSAAVLRQMDNMLRTAATPEDVNEALSIGVDHFSTRTGIRKRPRDAEFAAELTNYLMPVS